MRSLFKQYEGAFEEGDSEEKKEKSFSYAYSPFALQDALGQRDVKRIWLEYEKLLLAGIEAEELIHKVISKVKEMLAIKKGASKEDLGIKSDYPYNKSKKDSTNWKEEDLKKLYTGLIGIYYRIRVGNMANEVSVRSEELSTALERALLGI
jgi:DNA polymerase III delta subunit